MYLWIKLLEGELNNVLMILYIKRNPSFFTYITIAKIKKYIKFSGHS
jgi:hypothetical protein